jgi:hypothetical protein
LAVDVDVDVDVDESSFLVTVADSRIKWLGLSWGVLERAITRSPQVLAGIRAPTGWLECGRVGLLRLALWPGQLSGDCK